MAVDGNIKQRGPYVMTFPYSIEGMTHDLTFQCQLAGPVEPGMPPEDIFLRTKDGVGRTVANAAAAFWGLARKLLPNGLIVGQYTLERAQLGTDKLFYVSSGPLAGAGEGGAFVAARQLTLTFGTAKSSFARFLFLEGNHTSDTVAPLGANPASLLPHELFAAFVVSPNSPVLGTDASWIVRPISIADTQNEALYKARKRQ